MDQGLSTSPISNAADLLYVHYKGNIPGSQLKKYEFLVTVNIIILCPALIYIVLILTLWRAEFHVWSCGNKCFATVFAYLQAGIFIGQHKGKHHLHA